VQFRAVSPEKPLSSAERFCGIAMCLLKGSIVAGLIYWTYTEGLWGDSTETEDLYCRIMSTIFPTDESVNKHRVFFLNYRDPLPRFLEYRDTFYPQAQLPHLEGIRYSMSEAYNRALVKCMDIIVGVPLEMHRKLRDLLFPCDVTRGTKEAHAKRISA